MDKYFLGNSLKSTNFKEIWDDLNTFSPYGGDYKGKVKPSFSPNKLVKEYELTDILYKRILGHPAEIHELVDILNGLKDIRPTITRILKDVVLESEELFYLKRWLLDIERIKKILIKIGLYDKVSFKIQTIDNLLAELSLGNPGPSFYISDQYSETLKKLRQRKSQKTGLLEQMLQERKRRIEGMYNISLNIQGNLKVNKLEVSLIEELKKNEDIHYYGETYTHIEFKLKDNTTIQQLREQTKILTNQIELEEYQVREKLTQRIKPFSSKILENCRKIGKLDWLLVKATFAKEINGVIPTLIEEGLVIKEGRNPVLEKILAKGSKEMTPINLQLSRGVTVITGANMGGKSVVLKTVGLLLALAQYGFLVPCKSFSFSPVEFIYYSQGDGQSIYDGLSTFGWEMNEIKKAIDINKKIGIYLIDELARGTNPIEGGALALSVARFLNKKRSYTIMTTHFEEMITKEFRQLRIVGLDKLTQRQLKRALKNQGGFEKIQELMDYQLVDLEEMGLPREGVKIAALLGLPEEIIEDAKLNLKRREV